VNYEKTGNILLSRILGAEVRLDPAGFDIGFRKSWEEAIASVEERGGKPYPIPAGASDHTLGGHGFAGWAFELEDQEKELGFAFDNVIVCSVTGSTQGGMIAGFAHSDRAQSVLGIDASATVEKTWEQIARIARTHRGRHRIRPRGTGRRNCPPRPLARRNLWHRWPSDHRGN